METKQYHNKYSDNRDMTEKPDINSLGLVPAEFDQINEGVADLIQTIQVHGSI